MIIRQVSDAVMRRKKYELIRMSETCLCGNYKWQGVAFCRGCTGRLDRQHRAALFTSDPIKWPAAYDAAAATLTGGKTDG
jgi:hypothetical protein